MDPILYLYTTEGCHLCEQALAIIQPLASEKKLTLELVEISESDTLVEQYGIRIPVIRFNDWQEELGWPFDQAAVEVYLARVKA